MLILANSTASSFTISNFWVWLVQTLLCAGSSSTYGLKTSNFRHVTIFSEISAQPAVTHHSCDISLDLEGMWPVTAKLIEMAQYLSGHYPTHLAALLTLYWDPLLYYPVIISVEIQLQQISK
jgi:hypothetical protein